MVNNDPWYTRSEFWTALVGFIQGPLIGLIPGVGPFVGIASAVLSAAAPIVYIVGRGQVKASQAGQSVTK